MDPTGCLRLLCPRPHQVRELMPLKESEEALARSSLESENVTLLRRVKALEEYNQLLERIRQLQEEHNTIID